MFKTERRMVKAILKERCLFKYNEGDVVKCASTGKEDIVVCKSYWVQDYFGNVHFYSDDLDCEIFLYDYNSNKYAEIVRDSTSNFTVFF